MVFVIKSALLRILLHLITGDTFPIPDFVVILSERTIYKSKGYLFMKAVRIHTYGNSDVLKIENITMPSISDDEILIKIHATSINPVDWKVREGHLQSMNIHTLPLTLGWDVSGVVEKTGGNVKQFKIGDEVYTRPALERDGSYAEHIVVKAKEVAFKPKSITHVEAASLPLAGITAWEVLINTAQIKAGQKILIHAASGGVGTLAIQLAKNTGCHVIGTTSTANIDLVKSLGADEVIDYKNQEFNAIVKDVDVVFDTLGGDIQERSWNILKEGGILISIVSPPNQESAKKYKAKAGFVFIKPDAHVLAELAKLIDGNKIKPVVGSVFALDEIKKAHDLSQSGRAKGKIAITVV
jgi:NADPH:quinone reductase-like Zn-dependent oxidoreductase